ncbi:MAG: hypothetical protein E7060_02000 [Treponema bryantii]|nr:hypothetical protein [Treponema bryantii]
MIFKKVYLFLLSVFVLTCVSCKQNLNFDSESEDSNNCSVKICVENFSDARTIAPEVLDFSSMSDLEKEKYKFVLEYVSGRKTVSKEFSYNNISSRNAIIRNLKPGFYSFTLKVKQNDVVILSGSKSANVVSANTPVKFKLTPYGLAGTGSIDLNFKLHEDDVRLLGTGVTFDVQVISKKSGTPLEEKQVTRESDSYKYEITEVPAGCYVVKFLISDSGNNSSSEDDDIFACWQEDALYVEPGRETSKTIELPKLIYLPTWPESSTLTANPNSTNPSQIKFNWPKVLNAKYELQIKEILDDETIPTNESTWDSLSDTTGQAISEIISCEYIWEEAEIGKKYVARVRAINMCGKSEWKYLAEKVGVAE